MDEWDEINEKYWDLKRRLIISMADKELIKNHLQKGGKTTDYVKEKMREVFLESEKIEDEVEEFQKFLLKKRDQLK